jgi:hypothetical protein
MTAVVVHHPGSSRRWVRAGLATALAVSCLAGGALAVDMLRGNNPLVGSSNATAGPVVHAIGEDVKTSFGVVAVEHAVAISGLQDSQITGAHGVPGLVQAGSIDVQVGAVLTNLTNNVLTYQPTRSSCDRQHGRRRGHLCGCGAAGRVAAVRDRRVDRLRHDDRRPSVSKVRFVDPATKETILIGLGDVGCTVQSGAGLPPPASADAPRRRQETTPMADSGERLEVRAPRIGALAIAVVAAHGVGLWTHLVHRRSGARKRTTTFCTLDAHSTLSVPWC